MTKELTYNLQTFFELAPKQSSSAAYKKIAYIETYQAVLSALDHSRHKRPWSSNPDTPLLQQAANGILQELLSCDYISTERYHEEVEYISVGDTSIDGINIIYGG